MSSVATSPINSEPKTSTLDIGEDIRATLKEYEPEHGRCLNCDQPFQSGGAHKSCCRDECWSETAIASALLELVLTVGGEKSNTILLRLRGKAIEKLLNIMGVVMDHCSNPQTRETVRELFQTLPKSGLRIIPPCFRLNGTDFNPNKEDSRPGLRVTIHNYRNQLVVIKYPLARPEEYRDDKEGEKQWFYKVFVWKTIKHRRVLPLLGFLDTPDLGFVTLTPFCENNCATAFLRDMVKKHERFRWTDNYRIFVYRWLLQIVEGLDYLHGQGIVHGDLHDRNVLVVNSRPETPDSDFGYDILIGEPAIRFDYHNNSPFMAPELHEEVLSANPTEKLDSFSWAATAYSLFTTKRPYFGQRLNAFQIARNVLAHELPSECINLSINETAYDVQVPDDLWGVIADCWKGRHERPTVKEIIARLELMQKECPGDGYDYLKPEILSKIVL